jgi:hypothetical protein
VELTVVPPLAEFIHDLVCDRLNVKDDPLNCIERDTIIPQVTQARG